MKQFSFPSSVEMGEKSAKCGQIWCFGGLETGAIAVGVTNLVSLTLLYLWVIQMLMDYNHYFIAIVSASIITFLLFVVNVCLLFGSKHKKKSLILPWLIIYAIVFVLTIVFCSIKFKALSMLRPIVVVTLLIMAYFYAVILSFYHQILLKTNQKENSRNVVNTKDLIALEEAEEVEPLKHARGDEMLEETFTDLASQRNQSKATLNNPFLTPDIPTATYFSASFLPQPDEVIQVSDCNFPCVPDPEVSKLEQESNQALGFTPEKPVAGDDAEGMKASNTSGSVDVLESKSKLNNFSKSIDFNSEDVTDLSSVSPVNCNGIERNKKKSHSHSALIDIDSSSFSPFKQKESNRNMPKMKVFLPKEENSDEEISTEEEEEKEDIIQIQ